MKSDDNTIVMTSHMQFVSIIAGTIISQYITINKYFIGPYIILAIIWQSMTTGFLGLRVQSISEGAIFQRQRSKPNTHLVKSGSFYTILI